MTRNARYEAYYSARQDARIADASLQPRPVTLPAQAYGREPIEWARERPPVWVWVQWDRGPATRIAAWARGWNDRVVVVEWTGEHGTRDTVVWRQAVSRRYVGPVGGTEAGGRAGAARGGPPSRNAPRAGRA